MKEIIYVLDFGSQYSHLITRRIRELGVYSELVPHNFPLKKLKTARGIVLSGGPQNLSASGALRVSRAIFKLGRPILGICYGLQLTAFELGGRVKAGAKREYGPMEIRITKRSPLFRGLRPQQRTWMSHGDQVTALPKGFVGLAQSANCKFAAMADEERKIYGLQFHPEVAQTEQGQTILANFLRITGAEKTWKLQDFLEKTLAHIKKRVKNDHVVCALSGGVDSSVAATLVFQAVGGRLHCILVATGLGRLNEVQEIQKTFRKGFPSPGARLPDGQVGRVTRPPSSGRRPVGQRERSNRGLQLRVVDARQEFLQALHGVTDPERKRKIIGELFIRVFEREAKNPLLLSPSQRRGRKSGGGKIRWLVQGTLYTDAITSGVSIGKTAAVIKSHHNVGGLPKKLGLKLIEPLRELYKDEVRKIGRLLGLPKSITERQPFPGPALAVRIIGAVTEEKLDLLRRADAIVREEIKKSRENVQQYFAVLPSIRSVGVQGDARTYGYPIIIRAITTADYMTAHWAKLPHELLEKISVRITNEVPGVNRVVYDITSKPPGTVEWE